MRIIECGSAPPRNFSCTITKCIPPVSVNRNPHRLPPLRYRESCRGWRCRCPPCRLARGPGRRLGSRRCAILLARIEMDGSDDQEQHPAIRGLRTVCRCNNIKYRTIERAIRRGACTLTQIAACTTATTGHCGGSCTPDVQEMLDEHAPKPPLAQPPPKPAADANAWWVRGK